MYILLIIFGVLLVLFGGGCTLILGGLMVSDPGSFTSDLMLLLSIWLPLGLAPLALGIGLFKRGRKMDRERRAAATPPPADRGK